MAVVYCLSYDTSSCLLSPTSLPPLIYYRATMAHILSAVTGTQVDIVPITRALISVSDKSGIVDLCTHLHSHGVELLSTGGTAKTLRNAGLPCIDVSDYTNSPECLDGRVKTLHPKIHGGLLGVRGNAQHEADMKNNDIGLIDMTILNLYPFDATVKTGGDFAQCIENVDIGGPSMLRSTAKNHSFTTIVTSPDQYEEVKTCMLSNNGGTTLAMRRKFAARAFALSASYDSTIATWFGKQLAEEEGGVSSSVVTRVYKPEFALKYGKSSCFHRWFYLSHCSSHNYAHITCILHLTTTVRMQSPSKSSRDILPPQL